MPEPVRPVKVTTAAGAAVIDKDFAGLATPDDAVNLAFKLPGQVLDVPAWIRSRTLSALNTAMIP